MAYKGKSTTRGWVTLPPDIIRLILTHFILDISASAFLPQSWAQREHWLGRMAFNVVRDTEAIERIMSVSPTWAIAIEYHLYWQHAAAIFDPLDHFLLFAQQHRLTPYKHFRYNLLQRACVPCRLNQTHSSIGLCTAKRQVYTLSLGFVSCCKDHRRERFCGICLRDSSNEENGICANEDNDIWPQVEVTCRTCRQEWLWRQCLDGERLPGSELTKEAEAVGGRSLSPADWEARQAVEAFIEMGEGTIREVITICVEKLWLRKNTKISEMMDLAVATSRLQSRIAANMSGFGGSYGRMGNLYESEEELSELEPDDEDDDPDLMSITEDAGGVRELAINDWARTRILEGHWFSPFDQWCLLQNPDQRPTSTSDSQSQSTYPFPYIPARHPCHSPDPDDSEPHPPPSLVRSCPPSENLCRAAFEAFRRQMRLVLLPAMTNIVRRIVMECAEDGTDPCVRVAKMSVEDVVDALHERGMWYNGTDWLMRRREEAAEEKQRRMAEERKEDDGDDTSNSSKSRSQTTSPVLSTSTLQTTPSPPPVSDGNKSGFSSNTDEPDSPSTTVPSHTRTEPPSPILTLPIAISPVLESPTQIPSIPYIPVSMAEMPTFTIDTIKTIWRDACAPLFHCRCKVCERAVLKANMEAGLVVPSQVYEGQDYVRDVIVPAPQLVQVQLEPASEDDRQSLLSPSVIASSDVNLEEQQEDHMDVRKAAGRKRSCEVLEYTDENGSVLDGDDDSREDTPPKRQRIEEDSAENQHPDFNSNNVCTPIRLEKRRSEELGDVEDKSEPGLTTDPVLHKRARTDSKDMSSSSISPVPVLPPTSETLSEEVEATSRQPTPTLVSTRGQHAMKNVAPL